MRGLAYFLGIASGFGLTLQIGMNSKLRTVLQNANTAALISFLVGTTGLVVLAMALVVDHFGWLGMPEHPITLTRLAGVALLGFGAWLVAR